MSGRFEIASILAIADDLTGALETGAKFAARGISAEVSTDPRAKRSRDLLVIDTESRHLSPTDAAARVRAALKGRTSPRLFFKKTDSTLRGNIAAELEALAGTPLIYAPAYPALGRTVRNGQLLVDGVPVHLSSFAKDPLNPIQSSDIRTLLGALPATILDGETDQDLIEAARMVLASGPGTIAAGSAALAEALASELHPTHQPPREWPKIRRCLIVNGSLHETSIAQIANAPKAPNWELLQIHTSQKGLEHAKLTALAAKERLRQERFDTLIVFGGDTAYAIHHALGNPRFHPLGEILPGAVFSRSGSLNWITKAGGFGNPDFLCDIRERCT
ncbi:four-carbon acid sugar kinase family protein [Bryobacter aggregatus]|uniref:four-carbon acid sugar kinase family protein n=1 Tax=Bryobacter aggregatus TaxID=360054 RepID=UPI0004E1A908|nr:four-carbon acid sugar kinase family protein [Bryobacter aggregatus]